MENKVKNSIVKFNFKFFPSASSNLIFIIGVSYAQYMRNHMFTSYYF